MTGEHTCMVLKPLNTDDIEGSESDELGFFRPFYEGESCYILYEISIVYLGVHRLVHP